MFLPPLQIWEGFWIVVWVLGYSLLEALEVDWFLVMPGGRRGPSRQQLSRSALPSLQTLVGGSCGNGTGLRNRWAQRVVETSVAGTALKTRSLNPPWALHGSMDLWWKWGVGRGKPWVLYCGIMKWLIQEGASPVWQTSSVFSALL